MKNKAQQSKQVRIIGAVISIILGGLYLLNPTSGVLELIPDILPVVGNLDEAAATALLLYGISQLRGDRQLPSGAEDQEGAKRADRSEL